MSFEGVRTLSLPIARDREIKALRFVSFRVSDGEVDYPVEGEAAAYISVIESKLGESAPLSVAIVDGALVEVESGEALERGARVQTDDQGRAVLLGTGAQLGIALQSTAGAGEFVTIATVRGAGVGGGGGNGGGLELLYSDTQVNGSLGAAAVVGATVLTVADASIYTVDRRVQIGGEVHELESLTLPTTIEIASPGLVSAQASGVAVVQAPLLGDADTLTLPRPAGGSSLSEVSIHVIYDMPQHNGNPSFYNGRSTGAYYGHASRQGSYLETLSNFSYWWAFGQHDADPEGWAIGLIHGTRSLAANSWVIYLNPTTRQLSLVTVAASVNSLLPRTINLIVAGRA